MAGLRDLRISQRRAVPAHLLSVRFSRSSGPGGQNVNKVASKADVRLDLAGALSAIGADAVTRIRAKLATRLDGDGNLQVVSDEHRDQTANVEAAVARMESLIQGALQRPKKRRPTKPSRGSKERRLKEKKQRSQIKKWRSNAED